MREVGPGVEDLVPGNEVVFNPRRAVAPASDVGPRIFSVFLHDHIIDCYDRFGSLAVIQEPTMRMSAFGRIAVVQAIPKMTKF